jgi:ketosteroid isomerase-like protein
MTTSNIELVREVMALYDREGFEAVLQYADPEIEIQMGAGINQGARRGIEEGLAFTADWEEAWQDATYEIAEIEEIGDDTVLAKIETNLRGAGSGLDVSFTQWWIFGIRDGRFVRWQLYYDRDSALEAVQG